MQYSRCHVVPKAKHRIKTRVHLAVTMKTTPKNKLFKRKQKNFMQGNVLSQAVAFPTEKLPGRQPADHIESVSEFNI
jgi:hypothetical protein